MNNYSQQMNNCDEQEYAFHPEMLLEIAAPLNVMIEKAVSVLNLL